MESLTVGTRVHNIQGKTFWESDSILPRYPRKLKVTTFGYSFGLKSV